MPPTNSRPVPDLIVIGASARAACFSAARAGFMPYWLDQFGDTDLQAAFPGARIAPGAYPAGLVPALELAPPGPVLYTGALENHPGVLRKIAARRPLLGNPAGVCTEVRNPALLQDRLVAHGLEFPKILAAGVPAPDAGRWLLKPARSGGGLGIGVAPAGARAPTGYHLQQFMPGESYAGVYVAGGGEARLLGITRQLVGEARLYAPGFSWCGSIGPIDPPLQVLRQWQEIGRVLVQDFRLRGMFGVDAVVGNDEVTVIEVNPRYTASVEVLEAALDVSAVALHMSAWDQVLQSSTAGLPCLITRPDPTGMHGKACLFAPADLVFDPAALAGIGAADDLRVADIPAPGTRIARAAPILTLLCRAETMDACAARLLRAAAGIYRRLGMEGSGHAS